MIPISAEPSTSSTAHPEVRAVAGMLSGRWDAGLAIFRGIPFAEPPVGALRFAAPRSVRSWDGVRPARSYGPFPPQASNFGMNARSPEGAGDDWLTVNVWSPAPDPQAELPVMVWIYGGGYMIGASGLPENDGGRLARAGAVVVTFNYRLGFEGFAQIEGAPANRGLLDQVAALEWVRDNIRAFGGDPDRVTVFGESSGGGSVAALLAMPAAAGLFRRAIAQSVPGAFFSPALATAIATACASELELRPTVADLSTVDPALLPLAADLLTATMPEQPERWGQLAHRAMPFAPVIDGDVLPVTPWQALADGAGRHIDLVVGHTRDEFRLFTLIDGGIDVTPEQAATALRVFAPGPDGDHGYREGFPSAGPNELYELVHSDWLFRMPTIHLAQAQIAGRGRAYVYELTWSSPEVGDTFGACHGLDVPLVFGNLSSGVAGMLIGSPTPEVEALSAHMRGAWTAFATHGDPGWPAYETEQRLVQLFDVQPTITTYPEETSRRLWQDHTFTALPLGRSPVG